jgi:uncharacterized protein YodC (DUF2158 family)
MAEQFKPGDTVKLKSGGPLMTIQSITGDEAWCEWFNAKEERQSGSFGLHMLVHADGGPVIG